jgi:hypothetical protein
MVSGFTMTRASVQRVQTFRRADQNNRSKAVKGGRGRLRLSTALLSEGEDFESGVTATVKEYEDGRQD